MQSRASWVTDTTTTYSSKEEMIQSAKDRFDIQRNVSAEGEVVTVVNDIYNYDILVTSKVVIQSHQNPYNENREDRKIFFDYDTNVKRGSYVIWNNKWWLTLTKVEGNGAYRHATITECNNTLKWYDKFGKLHTYPCVFYPQTKANSFDFNQSIDIVNALCKIEVQYNDYTNQIKSSDRFVLNGLAYTVSSVGKHRMNDCFDPNSVSTIVFDLSVSETQPDDDLVNNIANITKYAYSLSINSDSFTCNVNTSGTLTSTVKLGEAVVEMPVTYKSSDESIVKIWQNGYYECYKNGVATITCTMADNDTCFDDVQITVTSVVVDVVAIRLSPTDTKILQGKSATYEVAKYINESKTDYVLNIDDVSTMASGYYTIVFGTNSFTITNIKRSSEKVKVKAYDNLGNSQTFEFTLGGAW